MFPGQDLCRGRSYAATMQLIPRSAWGSSRSTSPPGKFLAWVAAKGIAPPIPVWDHSHRKDGTFSRDEFKFDKERNATSTSAQGQEC